jgi:antitoxin (DNA-binding transcriptional repressor) of toxin-antitoxin stability system
MSMVNMHEAKSNLSRLVSAIANGVEEEIVIARNGQPMARLVSMPKMQVIRIGAGKGKYNLPEDFDDDDALIQAMFEGRVDE